VIEETVATERFKTVLRYVLWITLLCFAVNLGLVIFGNNSDPQKTFQATCDFGFKIGFGAILGLLGGKVA
jgi:hypothetical protein